MFSKKNPLMSRKHSRPPRLAGLSFLHRVLHRPQSSKYIFILKTEATQTPRDTQTPKLQQRQPGPGWRERSPKSQCEAGALDISALGAGPEVRSGTILHGSASSLVWWLGGGRGGGIGVPFRSRSLFFFHFILSVWALGTLMTASGSCASLNTA